MEPFNPPQQPVSGGPESETHTSLPNSQEFHPPEPESQKQPTSSVYPDPIRGAGVTGPTFVANESATMQVSVPAQVQRPISSFEVKNQESSTDTAPIPVVKGLSVRGVEYGMMTLSLWAAAASLLWILLAFIAGGAGFDTLIYPASFLIVTLPLFAFFYLRLRKAELEDPSLRLDPSKRRWTQLTQMLAFIVCVANAVAFVYRLLASVSGEADGSVGKAFLSLFMVIIVVGGILAYYWFDEHRSREA